MYPGHEGGSVDSGAVSDPPAPVLTITMDATDPAALAPFWAAALRYRVAGTEGGYVALVPLEGSGPNVLLQQVPEPKTAKNRTHLDLKVPDIEAEATRLEALGARRAAGPLSELGSRWIVMADPEGNEFCLCDGQGGC